ncbi:MAG: DMT family transporter [Rhodobacteraceae bacterium]|nr:DMT family transporter [Paracoccaceae bacterium]
MRDAPATSDLVTHTDNKRGAAWMFCSAVFFSLIAMGIKKAGENLPTAEIVFFRCLFGMTVVAPFIARQGLSVYRTQRPGLHVSRLICAAIGMNSGFYAVTHLELATAVSLSYTRPLFMILLAVIFLGEVVRWRRGLATIVGFGGVLIMLGPSHVPFSWAVAAGLLSALAVAGAMAVVKQQAATDGPATIMAWFATGTVFLTAIPAMFVWQTPSGEQWFWLVSIGITASLGQYMMIKAFSIGDATVMNPIDYVQIIFVTALGYWVFDEIPSIWTGVGAAVIVVSTLYILFRESVVKQAPATPLIKE